MDQEVTARISIDRDARSRVGDIAQKLSRLGFHVLSAGRFGITLAAKKDLFEAIFAIRLSLRDGAVDVIGQPKIPSDLGIDSDKLYFPTKPTTFP